MFEICRDPDNISQWRSGESTKGLVSQTVLIIRPESPITNIARQFGMTTTGRLKSVLVRTQSLSVVCPIDPLDSSED